MGERRASRRFAATVKTARGFNIAGEHSPLKRAINDIEERVLM